MENLTRRAALSGTIVSLAGAGFAGAIAAPAVRATDPGIGEKLAALIAEADRKDEAYRAYYDTSYLPVELRHSTAKGTPAEADTTREWNAINDHFDMLVSRCSDAQCAVARHTVTSGAELHAKIGFMAKHQMFDGMNWTTEMVADAASLANLEGRA